MPPKVLLTLVLVLPPIFFIWCGAFCAVENLVMPSCGMTLLGLLNVWAVARILSPVLQPAS